MPGCKIVSATLVNCLVFTSPYTIRAFGVGSALVVVIILKTKLHRT